MVVQTLLVACSAVDNSACLGDPTCNCTCEADTLLSREEGDSSTCSVERTLCSNQACWLRRLVWASVALFRACSLNVFGAAVFCSFATNVPPAPRLPGWCKEPDADRLVELTPSLEWIKVGLMTRDRRFGAGAVPSVHC
eukprot:1652363-Prymnesium_polylepis.1